MAIARLTGTTIPVCEAEEVDDLATLTNLDDPILCDQLHKRYDGSPAKIYTYVGDILVAVNPFRPLEIYGTESQKLYMKTTKVNRAPHIYGIADAAYGDMVASDGTKSQCCIVSGESGAGKTESAKYIIRQLMLLCKTASDDGTSKDLEGKILAVNPLLEAFGNAQTEKNDNSSRFGKYTELVFTNGGKVLGSDISIYLLEKSRVSDPGGENEGEQNFHMFYYLFAENASAAQYGLRVAEMESYRFISNVDGVDDVELEKEYGEVVSAMVEVGFNPDERTAVWGVLGAILHLGQVEFEAPVEWANINPKSEPSVELVAKFLGVAPKDLREVLLGKWLQTPGESGGRTRKPYNLNAANANRDATARALYGKLFSWIVLNVNQLLSPPPAKAAAGRKAARRGPGDHRDARPSIGILDIFGFEDFHYNSFEQLCINLANEQLQFFFNEHVFKYEQAEYTKEGIDIANITYQDNEPLLKMHLDPKNELKSRKGEFSLFQLLDDACKVDTDRDEQQKERAAEDLVTKFDATFKKQDPPIYVPKMGINTQFTIIHYAGNVEYHANRFLDKNRDALSADVVMCMQKSGNAVVSELFLVQVDAKTGADTAVVSRGDSDAVKATKLAAARSAYDWKGGMTIGKQFKVSLHQLYSKMEICTPHFVRCIKPNTGKEPWNFQDDFVMKQLQYTGMLATTRIRREGFAVRPKFQEFISRFRVLGFDRNDLLDDTSSNCQKILKAAGINGAMLGKTKVFLKHYHMDELESRILELAISATMVQKWWRGHMARKLYRGEKNQQAERAAQGTAFLDSISVQHAKYHGQLQAHIVQDEQRFEDVLRQREEERRKLAEAKARAQREAEEAERAKLEEEQRRIRAEYKLAEEEINRLLEAIRRAAQEHGDIRPLVKELSAKLAEFQEKMLAQIAVQKDSLSELQTQSQLKLNSQADLVKERDLIVRELSAKASRGGPAAAGAVKSLSAKLSAQESVVEDAASEGRMVTVRLESQSKIVETAQQQHTGMMRKCNGALEEANRYVLGWCDEQEAELAAAAAKLKRLQAERDDALTRAAEDLADSQRENDRLVAQEAAQREAARSELVDKEGANSQLQQVLESAETEIKELTLQVAAIKAEHNSTKDLAAGEADVAKSTLAAARDDHAAEKTVAAKKAQEAEAALKAAIRQLEADKEGLAGEIKAAKQAADNAQRKARTELLGVQNELEDRMDDISSLKSRLERAERSAKADSADKEDAIGDLESKAVALVAERQLAQKQQTELRGQIRRLRTELDDAIGEAERLQTQASSRRAADASKSTESSEVSDQLRALLAEKTEVAEVRHVEHERQIAAFEAKLAEQTEQLRKAGGASAADLDELRMQLKQKDRYMIAQLADRDSNYAALQSKNTKLVAELSAANTAATAAKMQLQDSRSEVMQLTSRLETNGELFETLKGENLHALAEFQRLNAERNAAEAKRVADEQAIRLEIERENKALQTQLRVATAALDSAKQEYRRYHDELTRDHDDQISKLERILTDQREALEGLRTREAVLKERAAQLQHQLDEDAATFQANSDELSRLREALGESTLREQREKERSLTLHEQAMRDLESRLSLQTEAQKKNFMKLKKAIVKMARKRPGNSSPGEGAHVDLHNYITMVKGEDGIPHDIRVGRFTVKSYLIKMAAQVEQRRWLVLDLQQKTMSWFVDNRELRISRKGQFALADVVKVVDPGNKDSQQSRAFMIGVTKRTYTFIADTIELKECWMQFFRCVLGQG